MLDPNRGGADDASLPSVAALPTSSAALLPTTAAAVCLACSLPLSRCPAAYSTCAVCSSTLATGTTSQNDSPADADEPPAPAETHQPPGRSAVCDAWGYDLTWGTVCAAHDRLVQHASCDAAGRPSGFDSDDPDPDFCPCQYHPVLIEQLQDCHFNVLAWMRPADAVVPLCSSCWGASCSCGFVFDTAEDAAGVWPLDGRLRCGPCASTRD